MKIGTDSIEFREDRLLIHASARMDWPIREFCKVPIFFRGEKYYLRCKREGARPQEMIYELWAWPADLHEASPTAINYDESYVLERNRAAFQDKRHERLFKALILLYPVLGLFWSRCKRESFGRWGFEPASITGASILLIFSVSIGEAILVGWLGGGALAFLFSRSRLIPLDWALFLICTADSAMRYSQSLKFDVEYHWGFCEWLWPGRK